MPAEAGRAIICVYVYMYNPVKKFLSSSMGSSPKYSTDSWLVPPRRISNRRPSVGCAVN